MPRNYVCSNESEKSSPPLDKQSICGVNLLRHILAA